MNKVPTFLTPEPQLFQWYWVTSDQDRWLGCIISIASNYYELEGVFQIEKILFRDFEEKCLLEESASECILQDISNLQSKIETLFQEVQSILSESGIDTSKHLLGNSETKFLPRDDSEVASLALALDSTSSESFLSNVAESKNKVISLFKEITKGNSDLIAMMSGMSIPITARLKKEKDIITVFSRKVFATSLYTGLSEEVVVISNGKPAPSDTPIHLFQRRHYCDEECLISYKTGGMSFTNISDFDDFISGPERNRILPFPRSIVIFKVRRNIAVREPRSFSLEEFISIRGLEALDSKTFLYCRNGDQISRIESDISFPEKLFPDVQKLKQEKLWAKIGNDISIISDSEHDAILKDYDVSCSEWDERNERYEKEDVSDSPHKMPWPGIDPRYFQSHNTWIPYSKENVFFDEISEVRNLELQQHNHIAIVIQGLLDRSKVFSPHPRWQIWKDRDFSSALRLIYDDDHALTTGKKPDFEEYRSRLNASLCVGSITVGQQEQWLLAEGKKESRRLQRDYRYSGHYYPERFQPRGNPGPGVLARVSKLRKDLGYSFLRQRLCRDEKRDDIVTTFRCSRDNVLNVSAYKPGDFKIFFNDPRTREEYLQWAPLLLEAEEYYAGNRTIKEIS